MVEASEVVVEALARTVQLSESRLPEFRDHSARVAGLSAAVARELELPTGRVDDIRVAGLLHDIGMLAIPDEYLTRPGKLSQEEYHRIRAHSSIGAQLVGRFPFLRAAAIHIAYHHERWDGTGYPTGLRGLDIPLGGQIVGVAEAYTGLIEHREHRDAMSSSDAVDTLIGAEGAWFSQEIVFALARAVHARAASPPRHLQLMDPS